MTHLLFLIISFTITSAGAFAAALFFGDMAAVLALVLGLTISFILIAILIGGE